MGDSFDLESRVICQSLAETKAWCGNQDITTTVDETEDVKQRRALGQQAAELIRLASMRRNGFWNTLFRRDYTKSRSYRKATELYRSADLGSIAPLESQLRTPLLRPNSTHDTMALLFHWQKLVTSVVARRSEVAAVTQKDIVLVSEGRLLVYAPEENLADGAARYSSKGFFDVENAPPWDTWVAFHSGKLLSWVPAEFVPLAQCGIDVNPEECIRWL